MANDIILYTTEDGLSELQLKTQDGTVWLTQEEISELFQKSRSTVTEHLQNIFSENELSADSVCRNFRRTANDGKSYEVQHYNLDAVLAVGYRVKSPRGVQFRSWATTTLREYLVKGFVMNDERLKNAGGGDYFDELLARIREIRASEKLFYQKVKDVYTKSVDYDAQTEAAQVFFKTVQNKMLYAVSGMTAAELIKARADYAKENMGLQTWQGAKKGRGVKKADVVTAKNYLFETEMTSLNRIVTAYLDFAELTVENRKLMYMQDWQTRLDDFLKFNERSVLSNAGTVSHVHAEKIAHENYAQFDLNRREQEAINAEQEAAEELKQLEEAEKTLKKRGR